MTRSVLRSKIDRDAPVYQANRAALATQLTELNKLLEAVRAGGGPKYTERHHKRGKLLAHERIELLIDRDSPFLELSSVAAAGTEYHVGGSGVGWYRGRRGGRMRHHRQ